MISNTLEKWEEKTLHEVLNKVKYTSKIQSKLYKDKGKYPIISQEDVFISGYWDNPSDVYHVKHPIVIFGDHTKVVKYIDFDFVLGADGVKILDPTKDINAKFLYYWTKYVPLRNLGYARHYKLLSEKTIRFPSLPEQERIVEKLDKAFEAIDKVKANAEQNLNNAKELFESALNKVFTENTEGWEEKTLGEVTQIISGTTPDTTNVKFWGNENYWITPAEINENCLYVRDTARKITNYAIESCSLRPMPRGTVIFSSRAPIGKLAISDVDVLYCNQGFKNFICSKCLNSKFLYYFLLKNKQYLISLGKGTTFKEVSKSIVSSVEIKYPPLSEQQKIVEKLDALQEQTKQLEAIYTQKIKECDELKQSILQKAFRGEL